MLLERKKKVSQHEKRGDVKKKIYEDIFVTVGKKLMLSADKMTLATALDFCASCRSLKKVNRLMTGVFSFHVQYVINLKPTGRW